MDMEALPNELNVGKNIKYLREKRRLTQTELAEKIGATVNAVSTYERNKHSPKLPMIMKIAEALGTTLAQLISEDIEEAEQRKKYAIPNSMTAEEPSFYAKYNGDYVPLVLQEYYAQNPSTGASFYLPYLIGSRYRIFDLSSDQMHPTISRGDRVLVEKIEDIGVIRNGMLCILLTTHHGIIAQRVSLQNEKVLLKSDNSVYDDYEIQLSDIIEIWRVKEIIKVIY